MTANSFDFIISYWFEVWNVLQTNSILLFRFLFPFYIDIFVSVFDFCLHLLVHTQADNGNNNIKKI